MLTYSQRASMARTGAANLNATIAQAVASVAAQKATERAENIAAYQAKTAPVAYTPEQLKAAILIRSSTGWHRVVKVNAKSVTVATGYSWTDRVTLDKVLEVRAA